MSGAQHQERPDKEPDPAPSPHRQQSSLEFTEEELERRCHGTNDPPDSWEPRTWPRVCPSYRSFARILGVTIIGLLTWGMTYATLGRDAAPGGQLFELAALAIVAHLAGWAVTLVHLPALVGMLLTGIFMKNIGLVNITGNYLTLVSHLRKIALVIILTRAGLNLDPKALKTMKITLPKMDLIPWTFEVAVLAVSGHYILGLPWVWGLLLGSIVAAVSPAVVVPCLFNLRSKGYGVNKGIPTLLIAIAGIDGVASIVVFGILQSIVFSENEFWDQVFLVPIALFGGLGFGIVWGFISRIIPEKNDPFVVQLRVLMLLGAGLLAAFGSKIINLEGAGPLAVVTAAFVSCYFWQKDGWTIYNNPVSIAFDVFWVIFEPILFSVTGTQIILSELDETTVYLGTACLLIGIVARMLITISVGVGSNFNIKEKFFIALACMAKATVQAALGPALLEKVNKSEEVEHKRYGDVVLVVCFLSILLTAPIGAFVIMLSGPKLLKKTSTLKSDDQIQPNNVAVHDSLKVNEINGSVTLPVFKISDNVELPNVT